MIDTISLLTITNPSRCIGIDSTEIVKAIADVRDEGLEKEAIADLAGTGRLYRLEEIMSGNPETELRSILILHPKQGKEYAVAVSGTIEIINASINDILPVPDFVNRRQDPFFVWGFFKRSSGLMTLVTFSFIMTKGAL